MEGIRRKTGKEKGKEDLGQSGKDMEPPCAGTAKILQETE